MVTLWLLLAFLVPPAGLHFTRAPRKALITVSTLWALGQLIFWFFMAGPGFLVALLASLAATGVVLWTRRKERA